MVSRHYGRGRVLTPSCLLYVLTWLAIVQYCTVACASYVCTISIVVVEVVEIVDAVRRGRTLSYDWVRGYGYGYGHGYHSVCTTTIAGAGSAGAL